MIKKGKSELKRRDKIPLLSKIRFLQGLNCIKQLYFHCHHPDLSSPLGSTDMALLKTGIKVEKVARQRFPGGILVDENSLQKAIKKTQSLITGDRSSAIFQATFCYEDIIVKTDVLHPHENGGWDLIEVKSSSGIKEKHLPDLVIQYFVLNNCGIDVQHSSILHLNTEYVYKGSDYDLDDLFVMEELSKEVEEYQQGIDFLLKEMREPLWELEPPLVETGEQCPGCPFFDECHDESLENPVSELPRISKKLRRSLREDRINTISNIPDEYRGLSETQQRVRDVVVTGEDYFDPQIKEELKKVYYPVHFLDFESLAPSLPLFPQTHPYQMLVFQYSDHIIYDNGEIEHHEFLHNGRDDPRPSFCDSLLQTLGDEGSIVVYSSFEATRIKALAEEFPEHEEDLLKLFDRIVDLLPLIRNNIYLREFHGSFSIKSVLPALVPEASYDDLEIQDGMAASVSYEEMIGVDTPEDRHMGIRGDLLKYCKRDTEAMVWLFRRLMEM